TTDESFDSQFGAMRARACDGVLEPAAKRRRLVLRRSGPFDVVLVRVDQRDPRAGPTGELDRLLKRPLRAIAEVCPDHDPSRALHASNLARARVSRRQVSKGSP